MLFVPGMTAKKALETIAFKRKIFPNEGFMKSLIALDTKLFHPELVEQEELNNQTQTEKLKPLLANQTDLVVKAEEMKHDIEEHSEKEPTQNESKPAENIPEISEPSQHTWLFLLVRVIYELILT